MKKSILYPERLVLHTHRRIETSLNVPWRCVEPIVDDIDEWIIDIKDTDPFIYEKYTGLSNKNVMDNLFRLRDRVDVNRFHIRVPRIKGFNEEKDVEESVQWIRDVMKVEPEVFTYSTFVHTVKDRY